jgi:hypothetical protein
MYIHTKMPNFQARSEHQHNPDNKGEEDQIREGKRIALRKAGYLEWVEKSQKKRAMTHGSESVPTIELR